MLWSKIINLLSVPSDNYDLFAVGTPTKSVVKMVENSRVLTCREVEDNYAVSCEALEFYFQLEQFEQEVCWILTGMKQDDYENPLYDILEEDETPSDSDIEYAEHITDYDF